MTTFAEYTRKKKKKELDTSEVAKRSSTFREYTEAILGVEIAPIGSQVKTVTEVAPTTTSDKKSNGYFKKSEGGVGESVAGSSTDLLHKLTSGFVGAPESIGKGVMQLAPYMANLQKLNGGQYLTPEDLKEAEKEKERIAEKEIVKKDWYDEEKVAKKILGGVSAGVNLSNIAQTGGMATEEDWKRSRELSEGMTKYIDEDMEKNSVFGDDMDDVFKSGGEMLFRQVASPVANGLLLGFLSSLGTQASNALNEGASYDEATLSGLISGVGETGTELVSGGISFGSKTLDDILLDPFLKKIGNKALRTGTKITAEIAGEALEEAISEAISNAGTGVYKEESMKELLLSEEAIEGYKKAMISGGLLGGFGSGTKAVKSAIDGVDYTTGLNKSEEAVVEKEIENRIKEKETDEKKLDKKEKAKIREQVMEDLEKGRIDTDTIGSMFANDSYKNYMESVEKEEANLKEPRAKLSELNAKLKSLKAEQKTIKDAPNAYEAVEKVIQETKNQIQETENQILEIKNNSGRLQLQSKMDSEAFEILKETKLAESYHEKTRRGQKLEVDLESYQNDKAKRTAQNFKDFGANNSKEAHDFLEFTTKLAEEGDHSYKFMTIKQLEESIENGNPYNVDVDASDVEAFVSGNTNEIIIIMDANKSLRSLVGHEVMHTMEKANSYGAVQEFVFKLAKTRGEYDERLASIQRRYSNLTEEQQLQELTSDLIGDYLFGDTEFIRNLSTENPSVFKKIYNEIKYLWKMATAGSKEARELERVKKEFEKIWQETNSTETNAEAEEVSDSDVKYSLVDNQGRTLTKEQQEYFKDSKIRDNKGNLLTVYHGTTSNFDTFKKGDIGYHFGNKTTARNRVGHGKNTKLMECYINITNPIVINEDFGSWDADFKLTQYLFNHVR